MLRHTSIDGYSFLSLIRASEVVNCQLTLASLVFRLSAQAVASVSNLLQYALLKSSAERLLVQAIERKAEEIWVRFHPDTPLPPQKLAAFVKARRGATLRPDGTLRFQLPGRDGDLVNRLQNVLQELGGAHYDVERRAAPSELSKRTSCT